MPIRRIGNRRKSALARDPARHFDRSSCLRTTRIAATEHQRIAYKYAFNIVIAYFDSRDVGAAYVRIAVYSWHSDYSATM
jgi:hypothetical protein